MNLMKILFGGKLRTEKTILFILVTATSVVAYLNIFFRPSVETLSRLLPEVSRLKAEIKAAKSLIAREVAIEEEKEGLRLVMERYGDIFPSQQEIPKVLENLSVIAGDSRVKIIMTKPLTEEGSDAKKKGEIYQEFPIEIVAKSGYHQLGRFLQKLECGDRYIAIKNMTLKTNPRNVKSHNVQLIASTYILIEE